MSRRWLSEAQAQEDRPIQSARIGFGSPGKRTPKASTATSAYRLRAVASGPVRRLRFLAKALNRSAMFFGHRRGSLNSGAAGVCGSRGLSCWSRRFCLDRYEELPMTIQSNRSITRCVSA